MTNSILAFNTFSPGSHPPTYDFKKIDKALFKSVFEESLPLINAKWNNFNLQSPQDIDYAIKDLSESIFLAATKSCTLNHPFTSYENLVDLGSGIFATEPETIS